MLAWVTICDCLSNTKQHALHFFHVELVLLLFCVMCVFMFVDKTQTYTIDN